jgi:hypothetical protein
VIAGSGLLLVSCGSDSVPGPPGAGGRGASGARGAADDAGPVGAGGSTGTGGAGAGGVVGAAGGAGSPVGGAGASGADRCGDGKATGLEPCDSADLRGASCTDFGFDAGELRCDPNFCIFDLSGCTSTNSACGNGKIDKGESCDGTDLGGRRCEDLGGSSGTLSCAMCNFVTTNCRLAVCGDGMAGNGEACDGADLRGLTCKTLGFPTGVLSCTKDTCELDDSRCERCGDGVIEEGEACDGTKLGQKTCRSVGFSGGKLACADCKLDTRACSRCGNGVIEGGENCDASGLGGATCTSLGLPEGTLKCSPSCLYDVGACGSSVPKCGDGVAEPGEECDGKDLTGLDCDALGKNGGKLGCSAACRFDTSGCVEPPRSDPCRDCRTQRCASQLDACKANTFCIAVLDCIARCSTSPTDMCWFSCANILPSPLPPEAANVLPLSLATFACTTSGCEDVCGGSL